MLIGKGWNNLGFIFRMQPVRKKLTLVEVFQIIVLGHGMEREPTFQPQLFFPGSLSPRLQPAKRPLAGPSRIIGAVI